MMPQCPAKPLTSAQVSQWDLGHVGHVWHVWHVGHVGHVGVRPSLQWMEANPVLEPPLPSESCVRAVFMG